MQELLKCGWTTIRFARSFEIILIFNKYRIPGDSDVGYAHLDVKRAIDEGLYDGPTIVGAGKDFLHVLECLFIVIRALLVVNWRRGRYKLYCK